MPAVPVPRPSRSMPFSVTLSLASVLTVMPTVATEMPAWVLSHTTLTDLVMVMAP